MLLPYTVHWHFMLDPSSCTLKISNHNLVHTIKLLSYLALADLSPIDLSLSGPSPSPTCSTPAGCPPFPSLMLASCFWNNACFWASWRSSINRCCSFSCCCWSWRIFCCAAYLKGRWKFWNELNRLEDPINWARIMWNEKSVKIHDLCDEACKWFVAWLSPIMDPLIITFVLPNQACHSYTLHMQQ